MRSLASLTGEARSILVRHCENDRLSMSVVPSVHLMRFGFASLPLVSTQFPCLALILQGTKSIEFAGGHIKYGAGQYLLASIDMPAASRIVSASKSQPLLALAVQIDFAELKEVMQRCHSLPRFNPQPGIEIFDADVDLMEAVVRLLRLLDTPEHAGPLAPLVRQEILYRLLSGPPGSRLLEICRSGSPSNRIAAATAWIRKHFAEGFMVGELAHHVGMSPSSLHQHFKAVTGMTPVQYQKRIRLHEARRSLVFDAVDIGEACVRVGYQSHSQFSKDYRHYFGRLPKDDVVAHVRGEIAIDAYTPEAPLRSGSIH
jgi:AraC-like DNA-binding protein